MTTTQAITCPNCGSHDLTEIAWNRRRCNNCGSESILSDDQSTLQVDTVRCHACGFPNQPDATFCANCGASLQRICPKCLDETGVEQAYCTRCGGGYDAERRKMVSDLSRELDRNAWYARGDVYVVSALRLQPNDVELRRLAGRIALRQDKWRQAVGEWSTVLKADAGDGETRALLQRFVDHYRPLVDARVLAERVRAAQAAGQAANGVAPDDLLATAWACV